MKTQLIQQRIEIMNECERLIHNYDSYKRITKTERLNYPIKACPSFRYRVELINTSLTSFVHRKKYVVKKGYYYTCGSGSIFGALFTACRGQIGFDHVKIYQYINRHTIEGIEQERLYHSSSHVYEDGLYYILLKEGNNTDFQLEMIDYLKNGIKQFPNIL